MSSPSFAPKTPSKASPQKRVHFEFDDDDDAMAIDQVTLFPGHGSPSNANASSSSQPTSSNTPQLVINGSSPLIFPSPYSPMVSTATAGRYPYPSPPEQWRDAQPRTATAPQVEIMSILTSGLGPERTRLLFDVRFPASNAGKTKLGASRPLEPVDRTRFATQPPVPRMRLISKDLAWTILVENPRGVTCDDVLNAIYQTLRKNLEEGEYYLSPKSTQDKLLRHYRENTKGDVGKVAQRTREEGVKRVDLLGNKTLFDGFTKPSPVDPLLVERVRNPQHKAETWVLHLKDERHNNMTP